MAKSQKYKLGAFEFAYKFTDADGQETVGISTPAQFAQMRMWQDKVIKDKTYTPEFCAELASNYHAMLVAKSLGLINEVKPGNAAAMYEFLNDYTVEDVTEEYRDKVKDKEKDDKDAQEENPTTSDQEGGQVA